MNSRHIAQLLVEKDIGSKFELVNVFTREIEDQSKTELRAPLIEYIMRTDAAQRISHFDTIRFYGPGCGLSRFVANQLLLSINVKVSEQRQVVLDELRKVLENFYESKNPLLKVTKAKTLVELVETFLGEAFYRITYQRHLSIFFVPLANKISNAAFHINTNSIGVFKTKESHIQTPEYIFLHEFGHVLHSRLFKTITEVPESFVQLNRNMNAEFFEYSKEDQLEIYADFFSIGVMLDTEYEYLNPFIKQMPREHTSLIRDYFIREISSLHVQ